MYSPAPCSVPGEHVNWPVSDLQLRSFPTYWNGIMENTKVGQVSRSIVNPQTGNCSAMVVRVAKLLMRSLQGLIALCVFCSPLQEMCCFFPVDTSSECWVRAGVRSNQ